MFSLLACRLPVQICLRFGTEGTWRYPEIRKTISRVNLKDEQNRGRPLGVAGSLCDGWCCEFLLCSVWASQSKLGRRVHASAHRHTAAAYVCVLCRSCHVSGLALVDPSSRRQLQCSGRTRDALGRWPCCARAASRGSSPGGVLAADASEASCSKGR